MPAEDDGLTAGMRESLDRELTPGQAVIASLSAISLSAGIMFSNLIEVLGQQLARVFESFQALRRFIEAMFDQPVVVLQAGAESTADWILTNDLGPFGFAIAVGSITAGWWVWRAAGQPTPFFGRITGFFRR